MKFVLCDVLKCFDFEVIFCYDILLYCYDWFSSFRNLENSFDLM